MWQLTGLKGTYCNYNIISKFCPLRKLYGEKQRKTAAIPGQLPPSSAAEPENSTKEEHVYEEVDLHKVKGVKPTDIQLTENAAYGTLK